jgi:hypothetical protein
MAIVDRNGQGYEVVLAEVDRHTPEAANFGALLFGELKITGSLASLLPFSDSFVLCEGGSQEP